MLVLIATPRAAAALLLCLGAVACTEPLTRAGLDQLDVPGQPDGASDVDPEVAEDAVAQDAVAGDALADDGAALADDDGSEDVGSAALDAGPEVDIVSGQCPAACAYNETCVAGTCAPTLVLSDWIDRDMGGELRDGCATDDGEIWVFGSDAAAARLDGGDVSPQVIPGWSGDILSCAHAAGNLWVAGPSGLARRTGGAWTLVNSSGSPTAVWTDGTSVVVAHSNQFVQEASVADPSTWSSPAFVPPAFTALNPPVITHLVGRSDDLWALGQRVLARRVGGEGEPWVDYRTASEEHETWRDAWFDADANVVYAGMDSDGVLKIQLPGGDRSTLEPKLWATAVYSLGGGAVFTGGTGNIGYYDGSGTGDYVVSGSTAGADIIVGTGKDNLWFVDSYSGNRAYLRHLSAILP